MAEPSSTPVGYSLQLVGSGSTYADFTWAVPAPESPGFLNVGQTIETSSVFDGGATLALLGLSLVGLARARRERR